MYTTGSKKDKSDRRDLHIAGIVGISDRLPKSFILEDKYPSKNQLNRGSCTSQAQAHHKERQEGKRMSARFIMAFSKLLEGNKGYGGYTRNSFKVVKNRGVCSDELLSEPSDAVSWKEYIDVKKISLDCIEDALKHKSKSYWRVNKDIDLVKNTLYKFRNSIVMSMAWHKEFNRPIKGVLPKKFGIRYAGHAVDCIGWDDEKEVLIFKNSWGVLWGDKGKFYMPYSIFNKVVWDCWCSLDLPDSYPVDERYGQKRTWASFMREQAMAFNPWLYKKIGRLPNNREINGLAYGYWGYKYIFTGKGGDLWLDMTKPEAQKRHLI